ncbi:Gfo/Idh/MocA family oxidoreductase [Elizabethkingia sp. JS20170427COW]|uniref:Gfo/Idh/MocA family oxidoreductase n=1 Tax=Elizabethkingia sp. JS20170427COW TaxID=2583851 RepID=UPI0011103095|nr:Gfo/Idh/MocA family oxidoreductase [Elizabethkingia sp. JS20170427COW]QCX54162.1 oxidoreductase [Elizabethkingia sp. JS20170427COW]
MQMINVGLCAYGMSGKYFHAPFIQEHPGFHLSAVVERHRQESKEKYPQTTIYTSVEQILEDAHIDLVVINTPIQTHLEYTKKALEAGKHVVVEKPFTVTAQQAEDLVQLAEQKNLTLSVYQNRRFDRDFLQVKEIINQGVLGKIKEVEIRFDRFRPQPGSKQHKEDVTLPGAGALHDLGAHLIDQMTQLFGKPEEIFADVFSMKGSQYANDYFEILAYYSSSLRVRVKSSVFAKEDYYAYKIFGDKGCFLQERSDSQEEELVAGNTPVFNKEWLKKTIQNDGLLHITNLEGKEVREEVTSKPTDYMYYYEDLYNHLVLGEAAPSPGKEIVLNMEIIDAVLASNTEGRKIKL